MSTAPVGQPNPDLFSSLPASFPFAIPCSSLMPQDDYRNQTKEKGLFSLPNERSQLTKTLDKLDRLKVKINTRDEQSGESSSVLASSLPNLSSSLLLSLEPKPPTPTPPVKSPSPLTLPETPQILPVIERSPSALLLETLEETGLVIEPAVCVEKAVSQNITITIENDQYRPKPEVKAYKKIGIAAGSLALVALSTKIPDRRLNFILLAAVVVIAAVYVLFKNCKILCTLEDRPPSPSLLV